MCARACVCVFVCVCARMCGHASLKYTHTGTHTRTHTHIHTHTRTHSLTHIHTRSTAQYALPPVDGLDLWPVLSGANTTRFGCGWLGGWVVVNMLCVAHWLKFGRSGQWLGLFFKSCWVVMAHNIQIMSADQAVLVVVLSFHFAVLIEHIYF